MRLLVFFLILFSSYGLAQEPVLLQLTTADGLPDNEIYEIREDHKGFVWIASNKGLIRYDGTEFVKFAHPDQRGLSVFEPFVDDDNRVWCMNISGQIFYVENEKMNLFSDLKEDLNGSLASINVAQNFLLISMFKKHILYDLETKKKKIIDITVNTPNYSIPTVINNQIEWYNDQSTFVLKDSNFKKTGSLPSQLIDWKNAPEHLLFIQGINQQRFLINQVRGKAVKVFEQNNNLWQELATPINLASRQIIAVYYLHDELWFLTDQGIYNFTIQNDRLILKDHFLTEYFTTSLFEDADLNLWVSTLRDGIVVIPNIHVKKIALPEELPSRLEKMNDSTVLMGFESGDVYTYQATSNRFNKIDLPSKSAISTIKYDSNKNKSYFFQKLNNYSYNHNTNELTAIKNRIGNVKNADITTSGEFLFANSGNVIKTSLRTTSFPKVQEYEMSYNKRGYSVIYDAKNETSYFATVTGLLTFNTNNEPQEIKTSNGSSILTRNLVQDIDGNIWAGTFTDGIYKISNGKVTDHINTQNGLSSSVINSIVLDGTNLWVATDQAIEKINTLTEEIIGLNSKDGIPEFSIRDMAVLGDQIILNTSQNVYSINKNKGFKPLYIPDYYFTNISINGINQPESDVYDIPDQETPISISYNVNGLRGLSNGSFEYRIKNQTEWTSQPTGSNVIQFASLPVGDLEFQLRQSGSSKTKGLFFTVNQVFYKSALFWIAVVGLLVAGVVLYYRRLLRFRESVKNEELKKLALDNELISLKLENLRSQMNPHFIFNALNSIQEYIVSNEKNLASSYLVKFSRLIRMYLDQSRDNEITLTQELDAMQLYLQLEKVRFEDKLIYDIQVDSNIKTDTVKVPPLFIQPYVENALKHGLLHKKTDRHLRLDFNLCKDTSCLEVIIIDNGIGREASQEIIANRSSYHKSFATHANIERVELLNRKRKQPLSVEIIDLKDHANSATGTEVRIIIPQEL